MGGRRGCGGLGGNKAWEERIRKQHGAVRLGGKGLETKKIVGERDLEEEERRGHKETKRGRGEEELGVERWRWE